jgi:hypothetical protein
MISVKLDSFGTLPILGEGGSLSNFKHYLSISNVEVEFFLTPSIARINYT